ncbi:hypothetical protein Tco_0567833 [Tanacetum coccineum]
MWRFLSRDNSLWFRTILAIHGSYGQGLAVAHPSNWSTIIKEVDVLKAQECSVMSKMSDSFTSSFRRVIRGGIKSTQLSDIMSILGSVILSSNED